MLHCLLTVFFLSIQYTSPRKGAGTRRSLYITGNSSYSFCQKWDNVSSAAVATSFLGRRGLSPCVETKELALATGGVSYLVLGSCCLARMERRHLESLDHGELQAEACRLHIPANGTREQLVERILDHFEKFGPVSDFRSHGETSRDQAMERSRQPSGNDEAACPSEMVQQIVTSVMTTMMKQQLELQKQQQQFMEKMLQLMAINRGPSPELSAPRTPSERAEEAGPSRESPAAVSNPSSGNGEARSDVLSGGVPGNQVAWLASPITEFEGSENDNVHAWIERVDAVAQIHRASSGVTLLAASSMLRKAAKEWYGYQKGPTIASWEGLKCEMTRIFDRELPYYRVLQKVEAKKWNASKETFDRYALAKLSLIDRLNLPQKDAIHLLVKGITNATIRTVALSLPKTLIADFLDRMREITEGTTDLAPKASAGTSAGTKERPCKNCGKRGHTHTECKAELTCFSCQNKGHRAADCPKPRARRLTPAATQRPTVAAAETSGRAMQATSTSVQDVAAVMSQEAASGRLEISKPFISVTAVAGRPCDYVALIDTGSPVSFIKNCLLTSLVSRSSNALIPVERKLRNLSGEAIDVRGVINTTISLRPLGDKEFSIDLHVLNNNVFEGDIILGRDFLKCQKLTLIYKSTDMKPDDVANVANLFALLPLNVVEDRRTDSLENLMEETEIDFGPVEKARLKNTVVNIHRSSVPLVQDDYAVKVHLKDDSVYAYAPRRFAYAERLQIRQITDDLLKRGVIRPSISPYCARVIPVRKRNGQIRLCVDLRPLNSRVIKQKYPFPIIEECLTRLCNKSVFTLLDLKDSFY